MKSDPHACGVDDTASLPVIPTMHAFAVNVAPVLDPVSCPVLGVGHFSQALPGHFCLAPKCTGTRAVINRMSAKDF